MALSVASSLNFGSHAVRGACIYEVSKVIVVWSLPISRSFASHEAFRIARIFVRIFPRDSAVFAPNLFRFVSRTSRSHLLPLFFPIRKGHIYH